MKPTHVKRIVAEVGSQTKLAKLLGTRQSTVAHWFHKTGVIPAEKAVELEKVTRGQIPRWKSRPDLWSAPK